MEAKISDIPKSISNLKSTKTKLIDPIIEQNNKHIM